MYIPKRYGESKIDRCPFCNHQATTVNKQKIPVCVKHRDSVLQDMMCVCGNYLETRVGKFGLYFYCIRCGNVTSKRVLEVNKPQVSAKDAADKKARHEVVRSDDPRYFD